MTFLLKFHGEMRWLVVLVGAIAVIKFASGWLRGADFEKLDRVLMLVFTILLVGGFYLLPRLVVKNTAMSRLTGGIGGRGPGETKLEVDRRRVRARVARLESGFNSSRA